tara:strand:- start:5877 stop:6233 length:357 start_codon:yes stop_codon:yes gene_type:complete
MIDQANDFINRRFQIFVFSGLYCLANLMQCFQPRVFISGRGSQPGYSPDVIASGISGAFWRLLKSFQPAENLNLHEQHGFEHFLCVVFSHVAFLLLVGGVATTTLAGFGVAFYFGGAV